MLAVLANNKCYPEMPNLVAGSSKIHCRPVHCLTQPPLVVGEGALHCCTLGRQKISFGYSTTLPVQSWQTDILFGCNSKRAKKIDHKKWPFFLGPIERENWGGWQRVAKFGGGSPNILSTTWVM